MKFVTSLLLLFATTLTLLGQPNNCDVLNLKGTTIVDFMDYSEASLKFLDAQDGQILNVRGTSNDFYNTSYVNNNQAIITNLPYGHSYEVETVDGCGNSYILERFSTTDQSRTGGIKVSDDTYAAILAFQKAVNPAPLTEFITDNAELSVHEKLAFLQDYYLDGVPIDGGDDLNEVVARVTAVIGTQIEFPTCRCGVIFNQSHYASTGIDRGNGRNGNYDFERDVIPKQSHGSNASYWYNRSDIGAAKSDFLFNEGFKSKRNKAYAYDYNVLGENNISPYFGRLAYNYLCTANGFPSVCPCEIPLILHYKYDTKVEAYSTNLSGAGGTKTAMTNTQDLAVATLRVGNSSEDVTVLGAGSAAMASSCNSVINREYFVEVLEVLSPLASLIIAITGEDASITNLAELITALTGQIEDLITTDFYDENDCGEGGTVEGTLVEGTEPVVLVPNEEVVLSLYSFSNQRVEGTRAWFNRSHIGSSFYMVGIIEGIIDVEPEECCTDKIANWVLASSSYPVSLSSIKRQAREHIDLKGPWEGTPTNTNYGIVTYDKGCSEFNDDGGDLRTIINPENETNSNKVYLGDFYLTIYDVQGREIHKSMTTLEETEMQQYLLENKVINNTGIYFVKKHYENSPPVTTKVFLKSNQ